jgi:nucleotide-binding universal stress UspA family protein
MTTIVILVLGWLALGAGVGFVEARRGHWVKLPLVTALMGPLAVPLVVVARQREAEVRPRWLASGRPAPGELDVLVGLDGTESSAAALATAVWLLGSRVRRLTLATVLDFDTMAPHGDSYLHPEPWEEETEAEASLADASAAVAAATGVVPATVVLAGRPADALEAHALFHGCDLIVVGPSRAGATHAALGRCGAQLVRHGRVPVLVVPGAAAHEPEASRTLRLPEAPAR